MKLLKILTQAASLAAVYYKTTHKTPIDEQRRAMDEFDYALKRVNDKENPSMKGIQKWFEKYGQ